MNSVTKLIEENLTEYEHFEYYKRVIIPKIERNLFSNPDIAIEACKSLMEGLSKTILKTLQSDITDKEIDAMDFPKIVKQMLAVFAENNSELEDDFVKRIMSLIHAIAELRNSRGDISHGKLAPKEIYSTSSFAQLVYKISEATSYYMLNEFYVIDELLNTRLDYFTKDMEEYNDYLDDQYPMPGVIFYSRSLFEQDYPAYEVGYREFLRDNNESEF